ncbi:MAG: hypothetical protein QOK03_478, partial [Candidatus Binataceae bacterium]|nr:hypothetical protein [Candidatus Binataceae bacterium]
MDDSNGNAEDDLHVSWRAIVFGPL